MQDVRHIVVLMLENRSFFNLLGDMRGVRGGLHDPRSLRPLRYSNRDAQGRAYACTPVNAETLCSSSTFPNDHAATRASVRGGGAGFVRAFERSFEALRHTLPDDGVQERNLVERCDQKGVWLGEPLTYFPFGSLPAIHGLARHFAVCDAWHASVPSATWPNRLFAMSGTSHGLTSMPMSPGDFRAAQLLQQNQETVFHLLQRARVSTKIYYHDAPLTLLAQRNWDPAVLALHHRMDAFFEDARPERWRTRFPQVAWIEPRYTGAANDFHPPHNPRNGDHLVGAVYNALRANRALWKHTLLVVTFDEHGGFFDPVKPPRVDARVLAQLKSAAERQQCFRRYGVRVPTLLVSPRLRRFGVIDSTLYDHTSLLKALCVRFALDPAPLGPRTCAANDFWHLFGAPADAQERRQLRACPASVALEPYDETVRSGQAGFWNSFQCEMVQTLSCTLDLYAGACERVAALKTLLPHSSAAFDFFTRFNREVRKLAHKPREQDNTHADDKDGQDDQDDHDNAAEAEAAADSAGWRSRCVIS